MIKEIDFFSKLYLVDFDDTVENIATKFNIDTSVIYEFNNITQIEKGDLLYIPKKNMAIHIVSPCETLDDIAKKYNVSSEYIKSKNDITTLFIGMKLYI